jgi:hypothetical protein
MNAPLDDITAFLGPLPSEEYEQRRRIRTCRNAASYKLTQTESAYARTLCWMVTNIATDWLYSRASLETLTEIVLLCRRLLKVADQFDEVEVAYYG